MKYQSILIFLAAILKLASAQAIQEFESVVTDQKFNSSSSVVIDREEIQKSRAKNLTTLLATEANIVVTPSNFQPNSIFIRGGDSSHILILVDGVPFYDAGSVQRTFNLNALNLKSIQRVEIIKGSQSVLFGGQALTAVIKIETIPKDLKNNGEALAEVGTQSSRSISAAGVIALNDNQGFAIRAGTSRKESLSPVLDSNKTYHTQLNNGEMVYIYRNSQISSFIKAITSFEQTSLPLLDRNTNLPRDTENFDTSSYQQGAIASAKLINTFAKPTLSVTLQKGARIYEQDAVYNPTNPDKEEYIGNLMVARLEITPVESDLLKLRLGTSYSEEKLNYTDLDPTRSISGETNFLGSFLKLESNPISNLKLETGVRLDQKKFKDDIYTYQVGVTLFDKVKVEHSTGFKPPSLFQLYSPSYGNLNLQPEKSISNSVSFEQNITTDWFFSTTVFDSLFTNLIIAKGTPLKYDNVSKSRTVGLELASGIRWTQQQLFFTGALGYQEPRDIDKDSWLLRRPLRTAGLRVRKEIKKLSLGLEVVHNGDRRDVTGASYGTIDAYTTLNSTAEYKASEDLSVFARAQNVANQRYQTSYGYYDEGLTLSFGAEASF